MDSVEESLHEMPFVWSVRTSALSQYCTFCLKKAAPPARTLCRCSLCHCTYYCDKHCQTADWTDHQIECKRFQAITMQLQQNKFPEELRASSQEYPDDFLRMVSRLVGKMMRDESHQVSSGGRRFGDLSSSVVEMANADTDAPKLAFEAFCKLYAHWVGRKHKKIHQMGLLPAYGKAKANLFVITDDAQVPIGVGLYLSLSRIGHSCAPNAAIVFRGKEATAIPVTKTAFDSPLQWSQLTRTMPNVDVLCSLEDRRIQLKERYFFECNCSACLDDYRNETMVAFACSDQLCMGRALPRVDSKGRRTIVCNKCKKALKKVEVEKADMAKRLCDNSLDGLREAKTPAKQREIMEKCVEAVQCTMHKYNIQRLNAMRGAFQCHLRDKNYSKAAKYGREVLDIWRYYAGEFDPDLLVFSMNMAGIVAANGDAQSAMSLVRSLIDRATHIHGRDSDALSYIDPNFDGVIQEIRQREQQVK